LLQSPHTYDLQTPSGHSEEEEPLSVVLEPLSVVLEPPPVAVLEPSAF
jgi:hypothetical protein